MSYTLKTLAENNTTRYLLCDSNQNYYSINKLLHDILFEYKNTSCPKEICARINKKRTDNFLTESYIEASLEKANEIIFKNTSPTSPIIEKQKYIKYKITIIKEGQLHKTYSVLSILFNKKIFVSLSVASIAISLSFFYINGLINIKALYNSLTASSSSINLILVFLLSLCIVLIHELGHASATFKFKIKPKEIGAGIYFIFPVLYTNVTNIWGLSAKKRMVVNFGGIYFQLLINCLLILFYNLNIFNNIVFLLLIFNTGSVLVSLNPFFRYDGYWLYSDLFGITNLKHKSASFITSAITYLYPNKIKKYISTNNIKLATIIYSVLNVAFWGWVYTLITLYLIKNIPQLASFVFLKEPFTLKSFGTLFNCSLIIFWIYYNKNYFFNRIKNINHAK